MPLLFFCNVQIFFIISFIVLLPFFYVVVSDLVLSTFGRNWYQLPDFRYHDVPSLNKMITCPFSKYA